MWRAKRVIALTIVISMVVLTIFQLNYAINVDYRYNKKIGAYLANAYDASTFEIMKEYYIKAKQGMLDEGLTPDLYGKWFYWEQTPDWQMNYTYRYIDGLIARCDHYINQTKQGNITPLTDVYNQMIENLRNESQRNGPVDWAARPAWMIKNAPLYYWGWGVWLCVILLAVVVTFLTLHLLLKVSGT